MSNRLSDVIARLQHLRDKFGNLEVSASTQDGAEYNVYDDNISVEKYIYKGETTKRYVFIQ